MKMLKLSETNTALMGRGLRAALVLISMLTGSAFAQQDFTASGIDAPLQALRPGIESSELFEDLASQNALRAARIVEYSTTRTYEVKDVNGKIHAREVGVMEYRAPDKKVFAVKSEDGSGLIRRLALNPLIASEIEASAGKQHHDSAITPNNYELVPVGEQQVGPYRCIVADAIPKRRDKYLFEGRIWIDAEDRAIVRIEGHPARRPSFWIERADFIREYQKVGGFWFPKRDTTLVHVRMYGTKILTIEHGDYVVNALAEKQSPVQTAHLY